MTSRRKFITQSALATAGAMAAPTYFQSLQAATSAVLSQTANTGKVLVVIQFSGGNDGLNTLIPFKNDLYYKFRPTIGISEDDAYEINDQVGFHPQLKIFKEFHDQGILSIINSVGYENAERSHLRAMEIWHTGSGSGEYNNKTGWIGRYLDASCPVCKKSYSAIEMDDSLSLALKGDKVKGIAVSDPNRTHANFASPFFKEIANIGEVSQENSSTHFLYKTLEETLLSVNYIYEKSKVYKTKTSYPLTQFGIDLRTVAELIISGIDTKVFYVTLPGFDTHTDQLQKQAKIFTKFSEGIKSFVQDLKANKKMNDVMIMTFSEFGRRVDENQSGGTDHGLANNVFLINGALKKPGLYNPMSDLTDIEAGGLRSHVDFKEIYATLLKKWLDADDKKVLGRDYVSLTMV